MVVPPPHRPKHTYGPSAPDFPKFSPALRCTFLGVGGVVPKSEKYRQTPLLKAHLVTVSDFNFSSALHQYFQITRISCLVFPGVLNRTILEKTPAIDSSPKSPGEVFVRLLMKTRVRKLSTKNWILGAILLSFSRDFEPYDLRTDRGNPFLSKISRGSFSRLSKKTPVRKIFDILSKTPIFSQSLFCFSGCGSEVTWI